MNKEASLIKLNSVTVELENNGYFQEADELHELYIKLAASKPWYAPVVAQIQSRRAAGAGHRFNRLQQIYAYAWHQKGVSQYSFRKMEDGYRGCASQVS